MNQTVSKPSREDVLDAFSVEASHDRETLLRYLGLYPQFAEDLVDLSRELSRPFAEYDEPLSGQDADLVNAAWEKHRSSAADCIPDPFAGLSVPELREVASKLDVPRQVVTAFRERRVIISTVPRRFLTRLADALNVAFDTMIAGLLGGPALAGVRSYRADDRPVVDGPVPFERILTDAGIEGERLSALMAEAD